MLKNRIATMLAEEKLIEAAHLGRGRMKQPTSKKMVISMISDPKSFVITA